MPCPARLRAREERRRGKRTGRVGRGSAQATMFENALWLADATYMRHHQAAAEAEKQTCGGRAPVGVAKRPLRSGSSVHLSEHALLSAGQAATWAMGKAKELMRGACRRW